jgi:hypothetical protein
VTDSNGNENGIRERMRPVEELPHAELQLLLEQVFENSRRAREDREYEEWLADTRRDTVLADHRLNADLEMELDDLERTAGG